MKYNKHNVELLPILWLYDQVPKKKAKHPPSRTHRPKGRRTMPTMR